MSEPTAEEFFILSHKRGFWSGNLVWWAPNRMGYTSVIDNAGRYSKADADDITDGGLSTDSQAAPKAGDGPMRVNGWGRRW